MEQESDGPGGPPPYFQTKLRTENNCLETAPSPPFFCQGLDPSLSWLTRLRAVSLSLVIGSLSNSVVERRTSTGSGPFASLGSGLFETLG